MQAHPRNHARTTFYRYLAPVALVSVLSLSFAFSPTASTTTPVHQEQAQEQQDETKKRSVDDIMRELEDADPAAGNENASDPGELFRAIEGTRGGGAAGTRKTRTSKTIMPEGTIIVDRAGRMVRSDIGGEWLFTFEADRNGKQDPPMVLMPCRRLERMEKLMEERADATVFRVSGQVFVYYDRNYLLPTWYQIPYERNNLSP
ncbi:MAG: hypothetical protein D8M59_15460 [Planctomycetes bacterium]|nr:hypothetical protein [Planctomycetota bacterium]NOG55572.1 hypothetical protein [Planctomycetota bacterium]